MENRTFRLLLLSAAITALLHGCASAPSEPAAVPAPEPVVEPAAEQPESYPMEEVPPAEEPLTLRPDHPDRYVVQKGDTLWDISARFLTDPWLWPELWQQNRYIENPHLIYPGDVLALVYIDGQPTLQVQRDGGRRTVRLSPEVRIEDLDQAVPTIPLDVIRPFLQRHRVVDEGELEAAPYMIATADEHLMGASGNRIYARGVEELEGADYQLVRQGQIYKDPDDGEVLGYEAIDVGGAQVEQFGDPATLMITESRREALNGDRLLPGSAEEITANFLPRAPDETVSGSIVAVIDGVTQIGQYQVVALNLGQRDGIEAGHVLAVYQKGRTVKDPVAGGNVTLPDQRAGVVMVFRPFNKMSYALVMDATRPMYVLDRVTNP